MQIAYHLGLHCTDEDRLLRCLLRNRAELAERGVAVPGPTRYRTLLRETAVSLNGRQADLETQDMVLAEILETDQKFDRMVLAWENFLAFPAWALRETLYPAAGNRLRSLVQIFPEHGAECHLAIRNPATFLPSLLMKQRGKSYQEFMQNLHPQDLFWSDVIADLARVNPQVPIHVWCDEDSPLIWPEIVRSVAGQPPGTPMADLDILLGNLMTETGLAAMNQRLATVHPNDLPQRHQIIAEHLEQNAIPGRMELSFELPGWTEDLIDVLTMQYDQDLERIAHIPGVRLTLPQGSMN